MSLTMVDIHDGVATVTFANPPRGYMDSQQVQELARIMDEIEADDAARAVVFTGGVHGVFIRHYDVNEILQAAGATRDSGLDEAGLMERAKDGNPISAIFERVDRLPKPTVAAINGYCQGGGFEFALCCDLRITEPGEFRIGLPEVNIGIFPGAGGTERLPRLIGEAKALELILQGKTLLPEEALEFGLVHEVAEEGALVRAHHIAAHLARLPARGLAEAKALVKRSAEKPLGVAEAYARGRFSTILLEDDAAIAAMEDFMKTGEDINQVH